MYDEIVTFQRLLSALHPCDFSSDAIFVYTVSQAVFQIRLCFSCMDVFSLTCLISTEASYGENYSAFQTVSPVTDRKTS